MTKESFYQLLDSGYGRKLEQFGPYSLIRPAAQCVWRPQLLEKVWQQAHASFSREPENRWIFKQPLPPSWKVEVSHIHFKIAPTDFGHLGIFPEQAEFWLWLQDHVQQALKQGREKVEILNLFAYSGGMTFAAARAGAHVCHLDASKGMVEWARENAALNGLASAPIRWIVDDVKKFLKRELRRGRRYEGIVLDPPSFGRGAQGEIFKIEDDLLPLLDDCAELLSERPLFLLLSCHTPGYTPIALDHLLSQMPRLRGGTVRTGEMTLKGESGVFPIPSGTFALWQAGGI